jgi:hypothetical protein
VVVIVLVIAAVAAVFGTIAFIIVFDPSHFSLQLNFGDVTHKKFCFHNMAFFNLYDI